MSYVHLAPRDSECVEASLPADTWTKVILLSQTPINDCVYACTTEENIKEKEKLINILSNCSQSFYKIEKYKYNELVAVEIDGKWHRGKLNSFNRFLPDNNTKVELIDDGSFYITSLENTFALPCFHPPKPLALFIKFKNFIPKTRQLIVKPLFSETGMLLSEGFVFVDVKLEDFNNKKQLEKQIIESTLANEIDVQSVTNGFDSPSSVQSRIKDYCAKLLPSFRKGDFSTLELEKDMPFKSGDYCILTYFEDFTNLYICPAEENDNTNFYKQSDFDLHKELQASKNYISKSNPIVGNVVKVFSPQFGEPFRAKILNKTKDNQYDVFYIDFGNIENVPSKYIFELDEKLKNVPGQAVQVGMSDLKHIKCTDEVKKIFEKCNDKLLVIEFDEESKNLENVKLKGYVNGNYINDLFSYKKPECTNVIQVNENSTLKNDIQIKQPSSLKNKDPVYLKNFDSMENIYVLRAADVEFYNETIIRIIKVKTNRKTNIKEGDIVKVVYDDKNYRAKIIRIGLRLITVMSIDLGYVDTVNLDHIYELPDNLQKVPCILFKIGIKNPILKKTKELSNYIRDSEKVLLCLEFDENDSNGCGNSILRRIDNSENIFDEFLRTYDEPVLNGILSQDQNNKILSVKDNMTNNFQSVDLQNGDYCIISYFESFESIYVCKAVKDFNDSYVTHNFDVVIKTMSSEDREVKINLSVGDFVKVLSPLFNDMYRATIIDIIENTKFHVFYIDFGNKEIVQSSDIFELSDELKIKTKLPLRVAIDVPSNVKKTVEIGNLFTNLTDSGVVLSIHFKTKNSSGLDNVILEEIVSGKSVNKEILKLLPVKKEMPLKNCDVCVISYFENFDNIYVFKKEDHNIQITIDTASSLDRNIKTNVAVGDLVKVFSPSFDDLYRAEVMNYVDEDNLKVFYIDFGSTEVVPMKNVFELSESLKMKPGIAIKVGIKVPSNVKVNEEIKKIFLSLGDALEPLSIEFDESREKGLENCTLKVLSSDVNLIDEVLKFSNQPLMSLEGHPRILASQNNNETVVNEELKENSFESELTSSVELKSGDIVFCCNFEDFNNVYLIKRSKIDDGPENFKFINDASKVKDTIKKKNPRCEDLVKVKWENKIFRARVLEKSNEFYTVFLIDIGKKIQLLGDNIYELSDNLKNIPGLAKKVGLKGVQDLKITKTVFDYFHCLWYTDSIPLILYYDEDNFNYINEVSLKKLNDGRDILEDLANISKLSTNGLQTNHINSVENISKLSANGPLINIIKSVERSPKIINGGSNNVWRIVNEDQVEFLNGFNVENIFIRCIRIYEEFKHNLEQLKQEKKENLKPKDPMPREIVAVYSSKFKGVYRGIVINTDTSGKFKCRLVDYGIFEFFPSQCIFELPSEYSSSKVPFLAHKVALKGLTKNGFNSPEINSYLSSIVGKTFIIEFDRNDSPWNLQVVLKELRSDVSLNEEIKKIPVNLLSQRLEKKIIINEREPKHKLHPIESGSFVRLTHFEDFNSIFIRNTSTDCALKFGEMSKQMMTMYRNATNNSPMTLNIGDKVCVRSSLNKTIFSRACILDRFGSEYNVFHLDFGNTELISPEDILELTKELQEIPDFAIKVQFKNVPPMLTNKVCQIKEYMKKKFILSSAIFKIEFNEANPEGLHDVILKINPDNKSIADVLMEVFNDIPLVNLITGNVQGNMDQRCQRPPNSPYLSRKNFMSSK